MLAAFKRRGGGEGLSLRVYRVMGRREGYGQILLQAADCRGVVR